MTNSLTPFGTRFDLMDDFRKEFDTLINRFLGETGAESTPISGWAPRLDLSENDTEYHVSIDLPGLKPEEVDVELRHGDLWITGQRQGETEEKGKTWHRLERYQGEFRRMVRLGDDVDPEGVDAEFAEGVLNITVPKTEASRSKKIAIKAR